MSLMLLALFLPIGLGISYVIFVAAEEAKKVGVHWTRERKMRARMQILRHQSPQTSLLRADMTGDAQPQTLVRPAMPEEENTPQTLLRPSTTNRNQ